MAWHNTVLEANNATPATAVAALNTAITALQTAASPQPINCMGYSSGVAVGPLYTYSAIFNYQG